MTDAPAFQHLIRITDLRGDRPFEVSLTPDSAARTAIAAELGLPALRKLRLQGQLSPLGKSDWRLTAELGATVVQDCVVTLAPVTTRIDEPVTRTYLADLPEPGEDEEIEIPEDDSVEPLPQSIDLGAVMIEALTLALPPYPHAEGARPLNQNFAQPGVTPLSDEQAKPFAGLAGLKQKLEKDGE